jgi:hypothetical protein
MVSGLVALVEQKIAQLALAAHDIEDEDLFSRMAVENPARTTHDFPVAPAFQFDRRLARSWVLLKPLQSGEYSLDQGASGRRILQCDVFSYFVEIC